MLLEDRDMPEIPGELMNEEVTRSLKQDVANLLERGSNLNFPGSQPISFDREHIEKLKHRDYFVCEKSDGIRCLMLILFSDSEGEGVFLITRENQYYRIPVIHFPSSIKDFNTFHNGTLLDGELLVAKRPDGTKELRYLVFDGLAINGKLLTLRSLTTRLGYVTEQFMKPYDAFKTQYKQDVDKFPFKVSFKFMDMSYDIPKVLKSLPLLNHVSDGMILTCCETPYVFGTDPTLLKWKPAEENTVDFKMEMVFKTYTDPDLEEHHPDKQYIDYDSLPAFKLRIWCGDDAYTDFAKLNVSEKDWARLKALGEPLQGRIVEASKSPEGNWQMLRFRNDKSDGNHIDVVSKILKSIESGVTKEELVEACQDIKNEWSQRKEYRKRKDHERREIEKRKHSQTAVAPPTAHVQTSNGRPHHEHESAQHQKRRKIEDEEVPVYEDDGEDDEDPDDY